MEEEYKSSLGIGEIEISKDVITTIAAVAALEVEGLVEQSSKSGISSVFNRGSSKIVETDLEDGRVKINVNIAVQYGYPVHKTAQQVQDNVQVQVEDMTGLEVSEVNVDVSALAFEGEEGEIEKIEG
ncbi:Asp23/Gls24 family envelope stress response protein [Candidatus Bipolaricaulota bacterium]|nr:Asp23/Gls24 family envelope stress response protein [Candidatus Bipolaricaulota bacterium]